MHLLEDSHYRKIRALKEEIEIIQSKLLDLKANLSRLKNPDFHEYTDEELDAMFAAALKFEKNLTNL